MTDSVRFTGSGMGEVAKLFFRDAAGVPVAPMMVEHGDRVPLIDEIKARYRLGDPVLLMFYMGEQYVIVDREQRTVVAQGPLTEYLAYSSPVKR